jgi:hypothetical protein
MSFGLRRIGYTLRSYREIASGGNFDKLFKEM